MGAFALSVLVSLFFYDRETKQLEMSPGATAAMFIPLWIAFAITVHRVATRRGEAPFGRRPFARTVDIVWFLAGIAAQFVIGVVYWALPIDMDDVGRPAREIFDRANENPFGVALLALAVGVGAPIMEELFYRGVVHRGFVLAFRRTGLVQRFAPILLSSAVFAVIHFQVLQFGALFAVGLLCAYAYQKTSRIISAIAVHAGFNLTTVAVLVASLGDKA